MKVWVTVKAKVLGIFSIMLALIVLFQAVSYYMTMRGVQRIAEFYDAARARGEALDLEHSFYQKLQALSNYAAFPDENHMDQLMYADKAFVKKTSEMGSRLQDGGAAGGALLARIRELNGVHDRAVEGLVGTRSDAAAGREVAAEMDRVEAVEKDILSCMDGLLSETRGVEAETGARAGRSGLARVLVSNFDPLLETGSEIHVQTRELLDYLAVRDLLLRRTIAGRRFLITGRERYVEDFNRYGAGVEGYMDSGGAPPKNGGGAKNVLDDMKASDDSVSAAFGKAVLTYRSGDRDRAAALVLGSFVDEEMLSTTLEDLVDKKTALVNAAYNSLEPTMKYALRYTRDLLIYIVAIAGLMAVIIYAAVSRMVRPIITLGDATRKVAQGDWTQRVEVRSRDEIGRMANSFNMMTAELEKAEQESLKRHAEISALHDVSRAIVRTIDRDELLALVLKTITGLELFNVERKGAIFIVDGEKMELVSHIGESVAFTKCREIKVGDCLCGLSALTKEVVISTDSSADERHGRSFPHVTPHGHIIVPLKAMDKLVGVLCLYLPAGVEIDEDKKMLLYILGGQIGIAISNAELYEKTKELALHDPLTGLANRRMMGIILEKSFGRAKRLGSPFSGIMLDIDHFKKYNDTYGHPAGDALLARVARIVLKEVREIDLVVRYGGEEFFVLLPDVTAPEAHQVAERIRLAVETGSEVTVSLGVSSYHQGFSEKEEVIKEADEALYRAKQGGRNRVEISRATPAGDAA